MSNSDLGAETRPVSSSVSRSAASRGDLADVDAALGQVPVALPGDVAEQELVRIEAAQATPQLRRRWRNGGTSSMVDCRRAAARRARAGAQAFGPGANSLAASRRSSSARLRRRRDVASPACPKPRAFALFATALGTCAIAWSDDRRDRRLAARASAPGRCGDKVARRHCGGAAKRRRRRVSPTPSTRSLASSPASPSTCATSLSTTPASTTSIAASTPSRANIDAGSVLTYGEVAARVGADASARAVGESLGRNAMPIVVPCHRVVASGGGSAASRRRAASRTKRACWRSRTPGPTGRPDSSTRQKRPRPKRAASRREHRAASGRQGRQRDRRRVGVDRRLDRARRAARRCRSGSRSRGRARWIAASTRVAARRVRRRSRRQ